MRRKAIFSRAIHCRDNTRLNSEKAPAQALQRQAGSPPLSAIRGARWTNTPCCGRVKKTPCGVNQRPLGACVPTAIAADRSPCSHIALSKMPCIGWREGGHDRPGVSRLETSPHIGPPIRDSGPSDPHTGPTRELFLFPPLNAPFPHRSRRSSGIGSVFALFFPEFQNMGFCGASAQAGGGVVMKYGVRNTLNATATHVKEDDVMSRAQCMSLEPGVVTSVLSKPDLNEGDDESRSRHSCQRITHRIGR